jgi:parallel beta-helix repeat protein
LGTSNVEISGLTLNGNWPLRPNGAQQDIIQGLGLTSNIYIHHNTFLNSPWVGIAFGFAENSSGTMQNIRIENNNITNTYSDAIFISHTLQPIVSHNSIYNIGDSGVVFSNFTCGGIIDANMIQKVGVTVGGQGVVVCSTGTNGVSVTDNTINLYGVTGARGIEVGWGDEETNYVSDITISGNTVSNGSSFLLLVIQSENVMVSGNHFINTTGVAIAEESPVIGNNTYSGNMIITSGSNRAVEIRGANDTFTGNTLISTTGTESGITVFASSDYNTISGNKISGYTYGIVVLTNAHTAIFDNDLRGCVIPIASDTTLPEHDNLADSGWLPET